MSYQDTLQAIHDRFSDEVDYIADNLGVTAQNTIVINKIVENIDRAWRAISNYIWLPYDADKTEYFIPLVTLAKAYLINANVVNSTLNGQSQLTQLTQGSRSVTFRSGTVELDRNGLTNEVKAMLPLSIRIL